MTKNAPDRKKNRKGKLLRRLFIGLAGLVVVLAILLLGVRQPQRIEAVASGAENLAVMNVVNKLSGSMFTANGKIAPISTVELTPAELNALLATGIRAYQMEHAAPSDPVLYAVWKEGKARLEISLPLLAGLAINAHATVLPEVADDKLTLKISNLGAGWLPIPGALAEGFAAQMLQELEKKPQYQAAMMVIRKIHVNEAGNLEITFIPSRISLLIGLLLQN